MENSDKIKLIALHHEVITSEEIFTIKELKDKYPKLWLQSQSDYQIFLNSCLGKWIDGQKDLIFNVGTFNVE